jgi:hypothetical protein
MGFAREVRKTAQPLGQRQHHVETSLGGVGNTSSLPQESGSPVWRAVMGTFFYLSATPRETTPDDEEK